MRALVAAGYQVFAVNPLQAARFRQRRSVSGAKSDAADAHTLADMVRTDRHQLRPVAGDSELAEAIKVVARAHKTLIWERTRHVQRLRNALREYFPAALDALEDLTSPDALELLGKAADPAAAARLTRTQITAALRRAGRRHVAERAEQIQTALRAEQLTQPATVAAAYAATVRSQVAVLATLNAEIATMQGEVAAHFGQHPAAEIYLSQPGLGVILGARVLSEFGDDPDRYADAKARKNYAGTSSDHPPIRQAEVRPRSLRPQRPTPRRARPASLHRFDRVTSGPRVLRPAPRPGQGPQRRAAPARQPARWDPARLPQDQHPLRRAHRMAHVPRRRRLTP